jgi:TRAP transporter 4TM/12TM fusion protein
VLTWASYALLIPAIYALVQVFLIQNTMSGGAMRIEPAVETWHFGFPLIFATASAIAISWFHRRTRGHLCPADLVLMVAAIASAGYLLIMFNSPLRASTGTSFAPIGISWAAIAGSLLILELTRRVTGLALVVISTIFLIYVFAGPYLPGFLGYPGLSLNRFFSQVYTDAGILGPTIAVSSTNIILFIIFAAFLQASKVGDYFVNFAFAVAGRARGGPAKVAIFASGLMGMINGTSAGNVVSTGSLTIPLMKKVGYPAKSAGAIEAAASTGGQIMPPIMGAGAFIMAEITGIPYTDIAVAALIPAILYFVSVYFMVDFEAARKGMRGMRKYEIPLFSKLIKQVYLFAPIIILIAALFMGYSVIRAGTLATASAAVVSWLTPHKMGILSILRALRLASIMAIQIIAVCACAGLIVGVISLTGVGARFSSLLLGLAGVSQLLALMFAMCISILLGMGMPTPAAYAVGAAVLGPPLLNLGFERLPAHLFLYFFASVSAITPPVAAGIFAAIAISGGTFMGTARYALTLACSLFILPFFFIFNPELTLAGEPLTIISAVVSALIGIAFLSIASIGYLGGRMSLISRLLVCLGAIVMVTPGLLANLVGVGCIASGLAANYYLRPTSRSRHP